MESTEAVRRQIPCIPSRSSLPPLRIILASRPHLNCSSLPAWPVLTSIVKERLEGRLELELEPELEAEADEAEADEAERRLSLVLSAEREHHSVTDLIRSLL
jgi:hypothetical protein